MNNEINKVIQNVEDDIVSEETKIKQGDPPILIIFIWYFVVQNSDPSMAPACASPKFRHYSGEPRYSVYHHSYGFLYWPSDFIGTIAGRALLIGAIEEPLLY